MIPIIPHNILILIIFIELTFYINNLVLVIPITWNIVVSTNNKLRGRT